jgi:hypothetical protein
MKTLLQLLFATIFFNAAFAQSWTAKAPVPANELQGAASFSIGTKGYVVTGSTFSSVGSNTLWEYDPLTNTWISKSNFPGTTRTWAVAFSIGTKGYVGTGYSTAAGACLNDFWEWDQLTDTWLQRANFPGTARRYSLGFSIDSLGYVGGGWDNAGGSGVIKGDFWQYSPATNSWTAKASFPTVRYASSGFSIGHKGYVSGGDVGVGTNFYTELLEYDPVADTWTAKASLPSSGGEPGRGRNLAFAFSIGTKGYIGTGIFVPTTGGLPVYCSDFWEWDQTTDTWTMKASFPGGNRQWSIGFSVGANGYAGTGEAGFVSFNDLWQFGTGVTGIENNITTEDILLFPNPAGNQFNLQFTGEKTVTCLKIYNTLDQLIYFSDVNSQVHTVDVSPLQNGIYFVHAIKDGNTLLKKKVLVLN